MKLLPYLIFYPHTGFDSGSEQARFWLSSFPANRILLEMVKRYYPLEASCCRICASEAWNLTDLREDPSVYLYPADRISSLFQSVPQASDPADLVLSNAGILTGLNSDHLNSVFSSFAWDVLAVCVDPELDYAREQVTVMRNQIIGFRRQYESTAEPDEPSDDWPDHLFCKSEICQRLPEQAWSSFPAFVDCCQKNGVVCRFVRVGGRRLDLFTPAGHNQLLEFSRTWPAGGSRNGLVCDPSVRIQGTIHTGRNVRIEPETVITAPAVLCDGASIGAGSVVRRVLAGPAVAIAPDSRIQRRVLIASAQTVQDTELPLQTANWETESREESVFRNWPAFSYPRFFKRMLDILVSFCILIFFVPFFPFIALAVKLTSSGPVFYRARRQGLHGKEFGCLKFRTMMEQAESLQEQLRFASQVDGPQFKMEDDPRVSPIGKFLRDTCIDELPQFFNVLAGQMSIVGPRPSPESENEFCPAWRDARLSVRPGITGLWQVCRTREASMDFQEWIRYDTIYVRQMSFRTDAWICFSTARMLIGKFLDQFG